jgi:hypothetical protein
MKAGDQFLVKLKLDKTRMLVYTVRHCAGADQRFKIGAELTDVVGDECDGAAVRDALLAASTCAATHKRAAAAAPRGPSLCT